MAASQKLGEKMYADMQAKQAAIAGAAAWAAVRAAAAGSGKPADDDVVDAEVKEVKKG
jgi:molecular chaperone DnaK